MHLPQLAVIPRMIKRVAARSCRASFLEISPENHSVTDACVKSVMSAHDHVSLMDPFFRVVGVMFCPKQPRKNGAKNEKQTKKKKTDHRDQQECRTDSLF